VRTDAGHAAEPTARLLESFEDTLGVKLTARPETRLVARAGCRRGRFEPECAPITTVRGVGYRFGGSAGVMVV
jgi:hypothetical protein